MEKDKPEIAMKKKEYYTEELEKSVQLIIKTKCPTKWIIEDLETGQRYRANGTTDIGTMYDSIDY